MNEQQTRKQGLRFTGCYVRSYDHDKAKTEAKQIRDLGFRAVVVMKPDSKLSRGPRGVGYSVFADRAYFDHLEIKLLEQRTDLSVYQDKVRKIQSRHAADLAELRAAWDSDATRLEALKAIYR